jgi:hypothetical protein
MIYCFAKLCYYSETLTSQTYVQAFEKVRYVFDMIG